MLAPATWMPSVQRKAHVDEGVSSAELSRVYPVDLTTMWAACTDSGRLSDWFGGVTGEFYQGGLVEADIQAEEPVQCRIVRCAAPNHLLVTWHYPPMPQEPVDQVELQLAPEGDGTRLTLVHRSVTPLAWQGVGPGWEDWLYRLEAALRGEATSATASDALEALLIPVWEALTPAP